MEQYSEALNQALQKRLAASPLPFLWRLYHYFRQRGGPGRELVTQELRKRRTANPTDNIIPLYPTSP